MYLADKECILSSSESIMYIESIQFTELIKITRTSNNLRSEEESSFGDFS